MRYTTLKTLTAPGDLSM